MEKKLVEGTIISEVAQTLVAADNIKEAFSTKQDQAHVDRSMKDGFAQFNLQDGQMQPYIAPDGKHIAINDKNNKLHLYAVAWKSIFVLCPILAGK